MPTITLYSKPNCPLCDHTRHYLRTLLAEAGDPGAWNVEEINILDDPALYAAYRTVIPVVVVAGGPPLPAPASMDVARLRQAIAEAAAPLPAPPPPPLAPAAAGGVPASRASQGSPHGILGALDRLANGLGKSWIAGANTLVGVFAALPWLAPVFAHLGWWALADPIYTLYMFFCHQLPERAGSLFGYQVAYCYRNTAIYTTIFLTGLLFALARRGGAGSRLAWMLRPIGWRAFAALLVPMAVDGMSHLLGLRESNAWFDALTGGRFGDFSVGDSLGTLNWWIRVITGTLFGYAVVRLLYPWIQIVFDESRRTVWTAPARPRPADSVPQVATMDDGRWTMDDGRWTACHGSRHRESMHVILAEV